MGRVRERSGVQWCTRCVHFKFICEGLLLESQLKAESWAALNMMKDSLYETDVKLMIRQWLILWAADRKSEMIRVRCSICTCLSSFCAEEQRVSFAFYRIVIMSMLSTSASLGRAFFALDICPAREMFRRDSSR